MLTVRGDRGAVIVMLAALVGASWGYLVYLSREMALMDPMLAMPMARTWSVTDLLLLWLMWSIMMVAMMLPSAAPMILLFASIQRSRREQARPYVPTGFFIGGYIVVWGLYSVLAALVQWGLHEAALLSPGMVSTSAILGGSLLVGAGLFQFTPLKDACLSTCRSPVNFLSTQWREGARGGWAMGIRHGAYCVGCCWMLMALLFVLGVMNLLWVAAIAIFALVEKLIPSGKIVSRVAGFAMVSAGVAMIILEI